MVVVDPGPQASSGGGNIFLLMRAGATSAPVSGRGGDTVKLGYVILYVPDVTAAVDFYERAFGLVRRYVHDSGQFAEMDTGETALAFAAEDLVAQDGLGFLPLRAQAAPPGVEVALVTGDVPAALDRAAAAGAQVVKKPEDKPWGQTVAYVRDPHGFLVELCTAVG